MINERKTENIIRDKIRELKYYRDDNLIIEEQKSDNPKIQKLLQNASKKGNGCGKPEFIIQYKNAELLIVIECKADITKHESERRDKFADYAVDGVLLYASYLSKEYDVLAIAVSGQTKRQLKISHFLHLKNENKSIPKFGNSILSADNYLNKYLEAPEKLRQDYNTLLDFTRRLNEKLHSYKIAESDRSLLISSILIALESTAFRKAFKDYETPEDLANALVQTVSDELKNAKIKPKNLENLNIQFSFIKTYKSLSEKQGILKELINEIDIKINSFRKTHQFFDVLGQFYIEFLRYANSEKGLGIVLTPPHITELFAELAQVNKDSIILDNTVGTGGFLISSMSRMVRDAKENEKKIKEIKSEQLIGVETAPRIYALAVSNMYIHNDGKTNIINGDCLDDEIVKTVKAKHPTIGLLNPPYQADKKQDTDELEFVLNNMECLVEGGRCVAIVPMQKALAQSGKVYEFKKELLEKHTLEAVLSMPGELFFNSDVGVVTCIMIFTSHKPHPKEKETFFGYYKDDGFIKRKIQGRFDAFGKWQGIRAEWLAYYLNRKSKAGFSINKIVSAKDEWCAEAYMETDYSRLENSAFEDTNLNYASFLFQNKLSFEVSRKSINAKQMPLNIGSWKPYTLISLFEITGSKTTPILELEEYGKGKYPFVTTQATNNGVEGFYNYFSDEGNILTVDSAVLGYCSYQPLHFSASDHVEKLIPNFQMNKYIAMFLVTIINLEQYRYNYGRKCCQDRMKQISIRLPARNNQPDFEFMEDYIKSLPYSSSL